MERRRRETLNQDGTNERGLKETRDEENGETAKEKIAKGIMEREN